MSDSDCHGQEQTRPSALGRGPVDQGKRRREPTHIHDAQDRRGKAGERVRAARQVRQNDRQHREEEHQRHPGGLGPPRGHHHRRAGGRARGGLGGQAARIGHGVELPQAQPGEHRDKHDEYVRERGTQIIASTAGMIASAVIRALQRRAPVAGISAPQAALLTLVFGDGVAQVLLAEIRPQHACTTNSA